MTGVEAEPNLFDFAPSELAQDAVLCWLLSWGDPRLRSLNSELHEAGWRLLTLIFRKHDLGCPSRASVTVHRQVDHADLIAEVGDEYLVLIEDKTKTSHHGDQLLRYARSMKKRYSGREILPVFLKTDDQCDFADIESCGYCVCKRSEILSCIWPDRSTRIKSDVLRNWAEYLNYKEESVGAFIQKPVAEWDWGQWIGFYQELRHQFSDLGWKYVPNAGGGFMGAWWGWQTVGHAKLYLQLDGHDLCFRVYAGGAANRSAIRDRWHRCLVQLGDSSQTIKPQRPTRFGNGNTMTVAVVPRDVWLATDASGVVDLPKTVGNLQAATRFLKRAATKTSAAHRVG